MTTPAIIFIILSAINLLLAARLHGTSRPDYNFWIVLLGSAITNGLLYWGGFYY